MKSLSLKIKSLLAAVLFFLFASVHAQVKIGSAGSPNSNAVLDLDGGTGKGLLLPRLSNTQITALTTAPDGLIVYNSTDGFLYVRKNSTWQKITDATNTSGGGLTLPYSGNAALANTLFSVNNTGVSDAIRGTGNSGDGINGFSNTGNGGYFTSTSGNALVTLTGNVGIGTTSPTFPLDINGRPRIRSNGAFNSAGIWYDKIYSSGQSSFVGTLNDSSFGIYGGGNWKFIFDHINNNFGINNADPKAPLSFSNATGNKLDIFYGSANSRYGIGLQAALMQVYSAGSTDDIAFGYGSSTSFVENMRIRGNGNVGIGILPTEKFEIRTGPGEVGWKQSWGGGSLQSVAPTLLTPAVIRANSAAVQLTSNTNVGLYIKLDGNIGAGVINPSTQLDVNGRMRIRGTANNLTNSAGIFFDGPTDIQRAFIGIETNDKIGIFGTGSGWGMSMNVNTGNANMYNSAAIGTTAAPNSKLQVAGSVSMPYVAINDLDYNVTDNDYSIHIVISNAANIFKTITLPNAAAKAGRIYVISAEIPESGTGVNYSKVTIIDGGTGGNVIGRVNIGQGIGPNNYLCRNHGIFNIANYNRHLYTKQTCITVQSDGIKWIVISNDFSSFDIDEYYN